ncbi:mitochondrial ATPase expression-domain-containing protein [Geopyxis carbonaria]|nr:mitochondrial ATPase expression-domain-containing protein [Geopyxis carbonaria]
MKTRSEGKLGQLRHSDFSAVLRSIQAAGYVSIQNRHKLLDSGHAIMLTEDAAFKEVKRKLQFVMWNMRWNGHHLSSSDYFHVLDCARQGDDVEFAEDVWNRLAGDTRVAANVWHYNSYMATVCGTSKTERWSRINDETLKRRTSSEEKNPRNKALVLLSRMTNRGVWPNSMTFDLVIMAAGKLGDMKRVRATLLKAWGVDVSNLPEDDIPEAERETSVRLPDDSPTYPTIHTLLAVAVTFGSNGHVDDAFRIVDYMSKRFNLEITRPTWIALLNWAYTSTFTKASDQTVPPTALVNIWTSMVSAPYNIRPTIEMHDYLVRSYLWRSMPDAAEGAMYSGLSLLASAYRQLERSEARLRALVADPRSRAHALSAERTALALAQRNIFRGRSIIRRWAELLALGHEQEMNVGFARTRIPDIVQNWGTFLGDGVVYFVQGGYVHLELGEARRWEPMMIRRRRREPWPLGTGAKEEDDLF